MTTQQDSTFNQLAKSYASAPSVVFLACAKRDMHAFLSRKYRGRSQYNMKTLHFVAGGFTGAMLVSEHPVLMTLGFGICAFHKSIDRALRHGPQQP
jgi:hypothetical protein